MLDIKFIRENKEVVQMGAKKKHIDFDVDALLLIDDKRKELLQKIESKKAEQSKQGIAIEKASTTEKVDLIRSMQKLKVELQKEEEQMKEVMKEWQRQMLLVPNVPDISVPEGNTEEQNVEVKASGEKMKFNFPAKSHIEIMENLNMADFEKGTEVAGFRGYFLKNAGAELSFAIWNYAKDFWIKKGFEFMIVPSLVRKQTLLGSGYLPQGEDDLYKTQDEDYLAGTGEVATMSYFADSIVEKSKLPIKVLAFSPCFRREAGSHSKDVKGLIRVHEFFKLEQVILCEASHAESVKYHEEINNNTEEFIESLGIAYRTVLNCGSDVGLGQVKKYDIELWIPGEGKYREISSASYFHDFQTRRLNIRYRDDQSKLRFLHSLNCTAIPTPRILVSLVENYQKEDGSVVIPEVLRPYLNNREVISRS